MITPRKISFISLKTINSILQLSMLPFQLWVSVDVMRCFEVHKYCCTEAYNQYEQQSYFSEQMTQNPKPILCSLCLGLQGLAHNNVFNSFLRIDSIWFLCYTSFCERTSAFSYRQLCEKTEIFASVTFSFAEYAVTVCLESLIDPFHYMQASGCSVVILVSRVTRLR